MAQILNPEVMAWAIDRSNLSVEDLQKRWTKLPKWLDGTAEPTLNQIQEFANKVRINLNLLYSESLPNLGLQIADFRTVGARQELPSPELYDTISQMLYRQDWMRSYFADEEYDEIPLVGMFASGITQSRRDVVYVATAIREYLELKEAWAFETTGYEDALKAFKDTIERKRIAVVINGVVGDNTHRSLDVGEFRGFVLSDPVAPIIFINGKDAKAAQIFTLAHELAHLAYASTGVVSPCEEDDSTAELDEERLCDEIAAELLVPTGLFASLWGKDSNTYKGMNALAKRFKVSFIVCARKALSLGLIDKDRFFSLHNEHKERLAQVEPKKKPSGGDFYRNKGYRLGHVFGEAVYIALQARQITYRDAYRLTGLNSKTFDEYFKGYAL